jgi:hypothetical protein
MPITPIALHKTKDIIINLQQINKTAIAKNPMTHPPL